MQGVGIFTEITVNVKEDEESQAFCLEHPTISWSQISIEISAEVLDVLTEQNLV